MWLSKNVPFPYSHNLVEITVPVDVGASKNYLPLTQRINVSLPSILPPITFSL